MDATPSRREFFHSTAAMAAGAGLVSVARTNQRLGRALEAPAPLAARRVPLRPDEPVRIGVIGTGGMGTGHVEQFVKLCKDGKVNLQVAALADVCQPRLESAKKKAEEVQG